jgi:hypothetical protein
MAFLYEGPNGIKMHPAHVRRTPQRRERLNPQLPDRRLSARRTLMNFLLHELDYERNSLTRLYASLLAAALADAEPELKRDYADRLQAHKIPPLER